MATALSFGAGVVAILAGTYFNSGTEWNLVGVGLWVLALITRIGVFAISRANAGHAE
ncbi:hypothetical protein ACFXHA_00490 [Nocardia sp. NPDC059240]|uniref:hypothetical protein n=1 Tax=Nocardia sp. NPDC059240 TaxID=3346786 RepID=UPI0036A4B121